MYLNDSEKIILEDWGKMVNIGGINLLAVMQKKNSLQKMKHQLPALNNPEIFEDMVCDLFNQLDSTNSYKRFGKSGHQQKGIDIFSVEKDVAIQCKKKDLTRKDVTVRRELFDDIEKDVNLILSKNLKIDIQKLYILSTYNDHPDIDEFCEKLKLQLEVKFEIVYWGWQTIENRISNYTNLLEKYWSNFVIKITSVEQEFKRNLDLRKQIKIDFADWVNYRFENRKKSSKMIIRAFDGTQYPHSNEPDEHGQYSWFGAEINGLYHQGMEFIMEVDSIAVFSNNKWKYRISESDKDFEIITVLKIGQINFADIVDYDTQGDEYYNRPIIFCKFKHQGTPFENYYYRNSQKIYQSFEMNDLLE